MGIAYPILLAFWHPILVCGLEHFLFFHLLGISYSQLTNSYFSEGVGSSTQQHCYGFQHGLWMFMILMIVNTNLTPILHVWGPKKITGLFMVSLCTHRHVFRGPLGSLRLHLSVNVPVAETSSILCIPPAPWPVGVEVTCDSPNKKARKQREDWRKNNEVRSPRSCGGPKIERFISLAVFYCLWWMFMVGRSIVNGVHKPT